MAFPPNNYVYCAVLQQYFVDRDTGLPLSGGSIYFFEDEARTIPKDVFIQQQQSDNSYVFANIGSVVTLSSVGTTQYNGTDCIIFLYPFDALGKKELYFIRVFSSDGILQLTREAYPPNTGAGSNTTSTFAGSENIVSNPQFAEVLFAPAPASGIVFTIPSAGTYAIAPDWNVITGSAGTLTVSQVSVTDTAAPGLPAFALDIKTSGFGQTISLVQTISNSPRLLENGFISGTFIAKASTAPSVVTMNYVPSNPAITPVLIVSGTAELGGYLPFSGTVPTPTGLELNPDGGLVGYIDIEFVIQDGSEVTLSCVQVVGVEDGTTSVDYIQESTPRQRDHLFHYWQPALNFKPIPSYLVGWDFNANPFQFGTTANVNITGGLGQYICDQTILWQSATNGTSYAQQSGSYNQLGINIRATTQFALIQYLGQLKTFELALQNLSSYIQLSCVQGVTATVSLWYTTNGSPFPNVAAGSNLTLLNGASALNANGYPVSLVNGWFEVPNIYGKATFTYTNASISDIGFNGWVAGAIPASATGFAIVIGTSSLAPGVMVGFSSMSLVPGDIPTMPAPQTPDEVLRECQYYYEKSYNPGSYAGDITLSGTRYSLNELAGGMTDVVYLQSFSLVFDENKRITPNLTFYSPASGTANLVQLRVLRNGADITPGMGGTGTSPMNVAISGNWDVSTYLSARSTVGICTQTSVKVYDSGATTGAPGDEAMLLYHYVADCRLGIL